MNTLWVITRGRLSCSRRGSAQEHDCGRAAVQLSTFEVVQHIFIHFHNVSLHWIKAAKFNKAVKYTSTRMVKYMVAAAVIYSLKFTCKSCATFTYFSLFRCKRQSGEGIISLFWPPPLRLLLYVHHKWIVFAENDNFLHVNLCLRLSVLTVRPSHSDCNSGLSFLMG